MVILALLLGIYSYLVLALGLVGQLTRLPVFIVTSVFVLFAAVYVKKNVRFTLPKIDKEAKKDKVVWIFLIILLIQVLVNLIGALSPELSFDALWYHLTSAKLYVQNHQIFFIPGNLLWPANTPHLVDMLYAVILLFSNEILAKFLHFLFGILTAVALFNLARRYFSLRISLAGVVTFYTMLIVGWQSTTAYVELGRTFFELLALDYFLRWVESKKENWLWESAVLTGLAISTKMLAFTTLGVFIILIVTLRGKGWPKRALKYIFFTLLVVAPWLTLSFMQTGNPLFPLFGNLKDSGINLAMDRGDLPLISEIVLAPVQLFKATFYPDSIISVVFLLFSPLVLVSIWKQKLAVKITALYVLLAIQLSLSYSNRYLLPYLPGLTLVVLSVFNFRWYRNGTMQKLLLGIIIFSALLNLGSRALATRKFIPYILQKESKDKFLARNLNFRFGDFYDTDGWFAKNIHKDDRVLIYDVHNLYYVDFPFDHESWAKEGDYYTHILVGSDKDLPKKFGRRILVHQNTLTGVQVFVYGKKLQ